jgi:hypothetical protein
VTAVIPAMRCNEAETSYADVMTRTWVPFALSDANLIKTLFLTACRHLCQVSLSPQWRESRQYTPFDQLAVKYKLDCVQSVRNAISVQTSSSSPYSHAMVGTVLMLAYDEASSVKCCEYLAVTATLTPDISLI